MALANGLKEVCIVVAMSPCHRCDNRSPGCHGICEVYKTWKEEQRKEKEDIRKKNKAFQREILNDNKLAQR